MYPFIEGTICLQSAETPALFAASAKAIGRFQHMLKDYPADTLYELSLIHIYLEGKAQPVGSDDLVIVNANVNHTESSVTANPLEYIVLGVDGLDFRFGEDGGTAFAIINYRENRCV